jgi:hypothetical protein
MADQQARVRSVDAIEAFRSALIVFLSKAKPTLEEIVGEVTRTRLWVENDRRLHWQREMKARARKLEQAQGELFSSRLSRIDTPSAAQQMAVHRAQAAVHEAEDKLRVLKRWEREMENRTEPMIKLIEQLHGYLSSDMGKAVAYLTEIIKTLRSYAEAQPAMANAAPTAPAEAASAGDAERTAAAEVTPPPGSTEEAKR